MDKEQARFILRSFRPNGSDVDDHDFAEALSMAVRDRELGEWLAGERSFDATFAAALESVELPQGLREEITKSLAENRADHPQAEHSPDAKMIGALATIHAPAALRGQILIAMQRSKSRNTTRRSWGRKLAFPLAAAAGIALSFFIFSQPALTRAFASSRPLPIDVVQAGFIQTYKSPVFSLDMKRQDQLELVNHLRSRKLPCPSCMPPGLAKVKGIGCRELIIDGKRGSLVCYYEQANGVVHLVIFRREDVSGDIPGRKRASFSQDGEWAAAHWSDDKHVFILIGATDIGKLSQLF